MFLSPIHTTARYLPGSPRARYKAAMASNTFEEEAEVEDTKEPEATEKDEEETKEKDDANKVPVMKKNSFTGEGSSKKQVEETKDTTKEPKESYFKS